MSEFSMSESAMQAIIMHIVMESKHHITAVPNVRNMYAWEADLISVTKSMLVHEFEIKISRSDFLADKKKKSKHSNLMHRFTGGNKARVGTPCYFWYAINGFDVDTAELPPYAGLMKVVPCEQRSGLYVPYYASPGWCVEEIKNAPRIHREKLTQKNIENINKWLSYKLKNMYTKKYLNDH